MKKNEIRIGNLFVNMAGGYGVKKGEVDTVNTIGFHGVNRWEDMGANGICLFDQMQPLPITDDWLLKFGFIYIMGSYVDERRPTKFIGCIHHKGDTSFLGKVGNTGIYQYRFDDTCIMSEIKYVHQLQNLYFALTGQELEIKQ